LLFNFGSRHGRPQLVDSAVMKLHPLTNNLCLSSFSNPPFPSTGPGVRYPQGEKMRGITAELIGVGGTRRYFIPSLRGLSKPPPLHESRLMLKIFSFSSHNAYYIIVCVFVSPHPFQELCNGFTIVGEVTEISGEAVTLPADVKPKPVA
jgi:hypothetical protein